MFNCDALRQALSDLLDGEVEPRVQAEVERHLSDCAACRILYDSARKTKLLGRTFKLLWGRGKRD